MAPEYGASTGYFPIDQQTLHYLEITGRSPEHIELVERYAKQQMLWFDPQVIPQYTSVIDIDLDSIEVSLAGPYRPQDRLSAAHTVDALHDLLTPASTKVLSDQEPPNCAVAIAAITSCTNTTEPRLLIAAGLLAQKARKLGLKSKPWVKTSLAPGSPTATRYLRRAGLLDELEALGFGVVGFGCTTCIGNSGPLTPQIHDAVKERQIVPVAVLSGNRNFPGRVHSDIEVGFLASPPMVIAYALAGDVNRNILADMIGRDSIGRSVYLSDLWPSGAEIDASLIAVDPQDVSAAYEEAEASETWRNLTTPDTTLFPWDPSSTYIKRPPFASLDHDARLGHSVAYPLIVLGDDVTTDHISPAGQIPAQGEAGHHLVSRNEDPFDLNVFAARRGNWEVMIRGLFTNKNLRNLLDPSSSIGYTLHVPSGERLPIWRAAERYKSNGEPVVIVAGERYGMGSSRDWAAKGLSLLGVKAVVASSFERIHRSNLIGMGILPVRLPKGLGPHELALRPGDRIEISIEPENLTPRGGIVIILHRAASTTEKFEARLAIETQLEITLLQKGGIIPLILGRIRESERAR
jgi:aconitate hydratase